VPRTGDQDIIFPKLDWQINQKHRLSGVSEPHALVVSRRHSNSSHHTNAIASFAMIRERYWAWPSLTALYRNLSNQVRFQYGRDFEFENAQTPTPYEQANLLHTALNPGYTNR